MIQLNFSLPIAGDKTFEYSTGIQSARIIKSTDSQKIRMYFVLFILDAFVCSNIAEKSDIKECSAF